MNTTKTKRNLALLTGAALLAPAILPALATPARAIDDKQYKTGAAVLGALAGYLVLKGKTVPGAVAGAGAYYAYKKSRDAENARYGSNDSYNSRSRNRNDSYSSRNENRDNSYDPSYDNADTRDDTYARDNRSNSRSRGNYNDSYDDSYNNDSTYDVGGYNDYPDDVGYNGVQSVVRSVLK